MKNLLTLLLPIIFALTLSSNPAYAIETAPHISDREIVERLTRLEDGQGSLRGEVKQLREDMNKQFDRLVNIVLCIIGVFASMCGGTIWFALWDRRSMIRPFEVALLLPGNSHTSRLHQPCDCLHTQGHGNHVPTLKFSNIIFGIRRLFR